MAYSLEAGLSDSNVPELADGAQPVAAITAPRNINRLRPQDILSIIQMLLYRPGLCDEHRADLLNC